MYTRGIYGLYTHIYTYIFYIYMDYDIFFAKHVIAICRLCMVIKHVVFCDPLQVSLLDFLGCWTISWPPASTARCGRSVMPSAALPKPQGTFGDPGDPRWVPVGQGLLQSMAH